MIIIILPHRKRPPYSKPRPKESNWQISQLADMISESVPFNLLGVIMATLQEQLTAIDDEATTINKQIKELRKALSTGNKLNVEQSDALDKLLLAGQGIAAKTKNALAADAKAAELTPAAEPTPDPDEAEPAEKKHRSHR
jgi:hypothetical protein